MSRYTSHLMFWLNLIILANIMTACHNPPDEEPLYVQNFKEYFWSHDDSFIYALYSNYRKDKNGSAYIVKVDVNNSKYEYFHESEGYAPEILDLDTRNDSVIAVYGDKPGLFSIQKEQVIQLIDTQKSSINGYAQYDNDFKYIFAHRTIGEYPNIKSEWGRYKLEDESFLEFNIPNLILDIKFVNVNKNNNIYLSNYMQFESIVSEKKEQHVIGKLDPETAKITDLEMLPAYSEGSLRFRAWLTEDEVLFSLMDENLRHIKSVSYQLSKRIYKAQPDFQQVGILSTDKLWVAYESNKKFIVSKPNGAQSRLILDIKRDLPKGDPQYIPSQILH